MYLYRRVIWYLLGSEGARARRADPVDMGVQEGWYSGNTGALVLGHEAGFEPDPGGSVF